MSFQKRIATMSPPEGPGCVGAPIGNADRFEMALHCRLSRGHACPLAFTRRAVAQCSVSNDHQRAVEALYNEAIIVADQARRWFGGPGATWRATLDISQQALVATESLATTARVLAIIAWSLDPRQTTTVLPFMRTDSDAPLAPPLIGTPGGELAAAARRLTARAAELTAATHSSPPNAANSRRLS